MAEPKTMKELLHAYRTKRPSKAKVALAKRKIIRAIEKKGIKKSHIKSEDINNLARILAVETTWNELRKPILNT